MADPNPKNTPDFENDCCPNPRGGPEHQRAFYESLTFTRPNDRGGDDRTDPRPHPVTGEERPLPETPAADAGE